MKKIVVVLLAILTAICAVGLVACGKGKEDVDPDTLAETGVWYAEVEEEKYTVEFYDGNKFNLSFGNEEKAGSYKVNGTALTLTVKGEEPYNAVMNGTVITLYYGETTYELYKEVTYTVTFNTAGGTAVEPKPVLNGQKVATPATPVKDGYTFVDWYADAQFKTVFDFAKPITKDVTVYAYFVEAASARVEFIATYFAEGTAADKTTQATVNGVLVDLPTPEKAGAEFVGWWMSDFNSADKLSTKYEGQVLKQDVNLYAVYESEAPIVSVNAQGITWTAPGANNTYTVTMQTADGDLDTQFVRGTSIAYDFANMAEGEYVISVTLGEETTTVYYNNKALARVSIFDVQGEVISWNAVEGAQNYLITIECGDEEHQHVEVDLGDATAYDFTNCDMKVGGIKFVVTATANGFAASKSNVFAFEQSLEQVTGVQVNNATQMLTWNAVEGATAYVVIINGQSVKVAETSYDIKEYAGQLAITVEAVATKYNSVPSETFNYNKAMLAAPTQLAVINKTLSWAAVAGTEKYNVMINGTAYEVTGTSFSLAPYVVAGVKEYEVSVQAVAENAANTSLYSEVLTVVAGQLANELTYDQGMITWQPVMEATSYDVMVNGEIVETVNSGAYAVEVTLTKEGENSLAVIARGEKGVIGTAVTSVVAYKVTFEVVDGEPVAPMYKAYGDPMDDLPEAISDDYNFVGWYTGPNGPVDGGSKYKQEYFQGADITLYVYWRPIPYTINMTLGDGETMEEVSKVVYYKQGYVLPIPEYVDKSKVFAGWYTEKNGAGIQYTDMDGTSIHNYLDVNDVTLYASWLEVLEFRDADNGESYSVASGAGILYVDEITVPETYLGKPVRKIDSFYDTDLVVINIPDSVTAIEDTAFDNCIYIQYVNIYPTEDNQRAFASQDGVLYKSSENNPYYMLKYFPKARSGAYIIPDGVEVIQQNVFKSNTKVTEIYIPASVTSIETSAFESASNVVKVEFLPVPEGQEAKALTISPNAFKSCLDLVEITLPARLTDFNVDAFASTSYLEKINIEDGNAVFKSVDGIIYTVEDNAAYYCPKGRTGSYTVPNGVRVIKEKAFEKCTKLTEVIIPGWVTTIEANAFNGCTKLESIIFEGLEEDAPLTIQASAFYGACCSELVLSKNIVKIEANAFGNISELISINVDVAATCVIEVNAFATTAATPVFYLQYVTLGKNVPTMEIKGVFGDKIVEANVHPENQFYESDEIGVLYDKGATQILYFPTSYVGDYSIPDTITYIGARVFENKNFKSITIGYKVTYIGEEAFYGCKQLTSLTFEPTPEGVEPVELVIEDKAFGYCNAFKTLVLPERLTYLGDKAFGWCHALEEAHLPSTLQEIGTGVGSVTDITSSQLFRYSSKLNNLTIAENNPNFAVIDNVIYKKVDGVIKEMLEVAPGSTKNITVPATVTYIWPEALYNNKGVAEVTFTEAETPQEVQIGNKSFYYMEKLTRMVLPKGLVTISAEMFYLCSKLEYVFIPNTVTLIENKAFSSCAKLSVIDFEGADVDEEGNELPLEELHFQDGTMSGGSSGPAVYYSPFSGCTSLRELTLPARFQMGAAGYRCKYLFANNTTLETVYLSAELREIGEYMFYHADGLTEVVFVDEEGKPTDDIALESLGQYAFYYAPITSFPLKEGLTEIATDAFGYTKLTDVVIPASVVEIGDYAFTGITTLGSITFAQNSKLEVIGNSAMAGSKTVTLTIPATVKEIGNNAFQNSPLLEEVIFEEGCQLETMGNYVFQNCQSLTSFTFPTNSYEEEVDGATVVKYNTIDIGTYLFAKCLNLTTVTLSPSIADIENAFANCYSITKVIVLPGSANFSQDDELPIILNAEGTAIRYIYGEIVGEFTIPEGYVEIEANAFAGQTKMTKITIPSTMKEIGNKAFNGCGSLKEVVFAGKSQLTTLGNYVFQFCRSLESIALPDTLTTIDTYSFQHCNSLKTVTLPNGLTSMKNYAFADCPALESIVLPATLNGTTTTTFGTGVFARCVSLKSVTLSEGIKFLGQQMFEDCTSLAEITLPSTLTKTGNYPFRRTAIVSVVVPTNLTTIGSGLFEYCTKLTNVEFNSKATDTGTYFARGCTSLKTISFPSTMKTINTYAFQDSGLESIDLTGITTIKNYAFKGTALKTVTLPATVKTASSSGTYMFQDCLQLKSVILEDGFSYITKYMFSGCTNLESVTMPETIKTIDDFAFTNSGIKEITIPYLVAKIGSADTKTSDTNGKDVFRNCVNLTKVIFLTKADGTSSLTNIGGAAFEGCTSLSTLEVWAVDATEPTAVNTVPSSVKVLGSASFANTGLTEFYVPSTVTTFGKDTTSRTLTTTYNTGVFQRCEQLEKVVFVEDETTKSKVTTICSASFALCPKLKTVDLPSTLTTMESLIFGGSGIETITIPASFTRMTDNRMFDGCDQLKEVIFEGPLTNIYQYTFTNCQALETIVIPNTVTEIGNYAFYQSEGLKNVTLPTALTTIGDYAFDTCTGLTQINFPANLISIGIQAFDGSGLTAVNFPANLTTIKSAAFWNTDITTVHIPAKVSSIADQAFGQCSNLTRITVDSSSPYYFAEGGMLYAKTNNQLICCPDGFVGEFVLPDNYTIGKYAFAYVDGLTKVTLPETLTELGTYAFANAAYVQEIILPDTMTEIGQFAFQNTASLTHIDLPEGLQVLGRDAFNASGIVEIVIPASVTEFGAYNMFKGAPNLERVEILAPITIVEYSTFQDCVSLREVILPDTVVEFDTYAFNNTPALESLTLPPNLEKMSTFTDSGIKRIAFPENITSIASSAFKGSALEEVDLTGIETIGSNAFENCVNLKKVVIPASVGTVSSTAFKGSGVEEVIFEGSATTIATNAFENCANLKKVVLPSELTAINSKVFFNCTSLKEIDIPATVTTYGSSCFAFSGLVEVELTGAAVSTGSSMFEGCESLTSVVFSEECIKLSSKTFLNCVNLAEVSLSEYTEQINSNAFEGCTSLMELRIPNSLCRAGTSIKCYKDAFIGWTSAQTIYIDAVPGAIALWDDAFAGRWNNDCQANIVFTQKIA